MIDKDILRQVLLEQNLPKKTNELILRELFNYLYDFEKIHSIIIISGVRRCGKSTLLQEVRSKYLDKSYYVNFDDERLINFRLEDFQVMHEILMELYGVKNIFFFDEIQNIKGWERFIRRIYDNGKKIYITGSNATMLSRELGSHLTGRYISFSLYPFSFKEFLKFKKFEINDVNKLISEEKSKLKSLFNEYLYKGGFPEFLQTEKEEYIKSVYENILYRDIITRYHLPYEKTIKEIVYYAVSNIAKEISFNTLKKLANLTSATTVKEYLGYLENVYLAFLISRYDISLKKQMYYNKKIYFIDTAIARILGFRSSQDQGGMLENIVFLQLKRSNNEIYFHKEKNECDFLIRKGIRIIQAIQVTKHLKENKEREINGLVDALTRYKLKEGIIITLDDEEELIIKNKKIKIKPIWKWLLE